mgnify:CR=1 FL=1
MGEVSWEEEEVQFKPTSTRDKILQSVFLIFIMYAIYRLFFDKSILVMVFLMVYALTIFYFYLVRCHKVVYTDYFEYYWRSVWKGWCRKKDKK